jgi:hypothetical protein
VKLPGAGSVLLALMAPLIWAEVPARPCPKTGISCEKTTTVDPASWIPLCVGTKWRYRETYESFTDNTGQHARIRWTSAQRVVSRTNCRNGVVTRIDSTPEDVERTYPPGLGADAIEWLASNIATPETIGYVTRGNAISRFSPRSWAEPCQSLTDEKVAEIDAGTPEFFFPMEKGLMWSDRTREEQDVAAICAAYRGEGGFPNPGFYYWAIDGQEDLDLPWRKVGGAFHLAYFTVGGPSHRWFVRGVGVVKELSHHAGSYLETSSVLQDFAAGEGCRDGR